ncbi:glycoside hydrolase family 43 protein [Actinoplanes sp. NPDC051851]|uniref:glycoside hydrolase family 43 protein n=1 Tax=Actinoplanes sp. NPDC051851 TaxID=3154753 RepID=UPI00341A223B
MKRRDLIIAAGGAAAGAFLLPEAARAATYSGYAMAYFTESPSMTAANYGLHLAVSADGLNWTPLNQNAAVATPTSGSLGLRDPFILRKQDGTFVVLATDLYGTDWSYQSQYLHVWDSTDLRTFTGYRLLKVHSLATHAWAPEAYWDAGRGKYAIVYSAVNDSGHNVLLVNYTSDFVSAGDPQVFYDPGYDAIDGSFVTVSGVNYMYYKNIRNVSTVPMQVRRGGVESVLANITGLRTVISSPAGRIKKRPALIVGRGAGALACGAVSAGVRADRRPGGFVLAGRASSRRVRPGGSRRSGRRSSVRRG